MSLRQTIRRILREEMEFSVGFKRRIETFKAIVWNNFAADYPCDYDNFSHFMRGIRQEIKDIILEGENDGQPISDWLTIKEAEDYIEKYMINDLKEFYVNRCLE